MRNPNSKISDPNSFVTCGGSRIHIRYEPRFNGKKLVLEEAGREDIQDLIESYAPYTDLNYMLHRLKVGDSSVLSLRQPVYGDFSGMPSNPVDAINLFNNAKNQFAGLDADTKKQYNNDFRLWLAGLLNGSDNSLDDSVSGSKPNTMVKESSSDESQC